MSFKWKRRISVFGYVLTLKAEFPVGEAVKERESIDRWWWQMICLKDCPLLPQTLLFLNININPNSNHKPYLIQFLHLPLTTTPNPLQFRLQSQFSKVPSSAPTLLHPTPKVNPSFPLNRLFPTYVYVFKRLLQF